jgi:hypothetical protein
LSAAKQGGLSRRLRLIHERHGLDQARLRALRAHTPGSLASHSKRRKQIVRNTLLGSAVAAALGFFVTPASAYPVYPWCGFYSIAGGATNCYFSYLWQCQQAVSGNGGYCYQNPFFTGYQVESTAPRKRYRRY